MPIKLLKSESEEELTIERIMYARRYSLVLDKTRCVVCEICEAVCPREAIHVIKHMEDGETAPPKIDIDVELCQYCGICNAICPFGALELRINGEKTIPVVNAESFPELIREITIDSSRCPIDCNECEEACPLNLIKVRVITPDGKEVKDLSSYPDKDRLKVEINLDKDHCPVCRICEAKCPYDAIHTSKIIHGFIRVNSELCPDGCHDCVDVCPIPNVLYILEDGKVSVNEPFCIYCGVCRVVCPVEGALELRRTSIRHKPVKSGAWNKALEKLTSTLDMTKELRSKAIARIQDSVKRRFVWRVS